MGLSNRTLAACLLVLMTVLTPKPAPAAPTTGPDAADLAALADGANAFAADLHARLANGAKGNQFCSPASIHTVLAMAYAGARGETASQMAKVLHYSLPAERLHPAFAARNVRLLPVEEKPAFELTVANGVWGQAGMHLLPDYVDLLKKCYGANLELADFVKQPEPARQAINAWVEKQTHEKIKDLIGPGVLDAQTRLVLANAIYFKSNWAFPFSKTATKDGPFKLADGQTVQTPLMRKQQSFGYAENDQLQAVSLPYAKFQLDMAVLLPKRPDGLVELEKSLAGGKLADLLKSIKPDEVDVTLPRFKFASQFELSKTLAAMGMPDAFGEKADFSGIKSGSAEEELYISHVLHKALVAVDEDGTEAAAATAVVMRAKNGHTPPPPKIFTADRPFLFVIRHLPTNTILFIGRLANPKG